MIRIGIIGAGYWGPNLIRCFQESSECEVVYVCDRDEKKLNQICERFPNVIGTKDDAEVLRRDRVDAVVIATPTKTHYRLAKRASRRGYTRLWKSRSLREAMSVLTSLSAPNRTGVCCSSGTCSCIQRPSRN